MIGLDALDKKILDSIGREPAHTSLLARALHQKRTTIQYRLNRLLTVKLVRCSTLGRKTVWKPLFRHAHNKNLIRIYKGDEIVAAYRQIFSLPKNSVLLCVQGKSAAFGELHNLPSLFLREAQSVFKRKKFVMKSISNEGILGAFDSLPDPLIRSHMGRALGLRLFSKDMFLSSGEIIATSGVLLLSNPSSKAAVVIKDKGIASIAYDTLSLLFELLDGSKNFDLNEYLKKS